MDNEVRYNPFGTKTIDVADNNTDFTINNDWIGGVDDTDGYVIVTDSNSANLVGSGTGGGIGAPIGANMPIFWKTADKTDNSLIDLINRLPHSPGGFTDAASAIAWVNGDYRYVLINQSVGGGMIMYYDAGNILSYPGSGTLLNNMGTVGNISGSIGTLFGVGYDSNIANGVFNFDGGSDRIDFDPYDFGGQMTVMAWVYPRPEYSINTLMANAFAGLNTNGFKLEWNSWQTQDLKMIIEAGNGSSGSTLETINPVILENQWQFLTYVIDFTSALGYLYHNGIQQATTGSLVSGINSNNQWNIGSMMGAYYMNANLGEFKVHTSLKTSQEILTEFNASKSRYGI